VKGNRTPFGGEDDPKDLDDVVVCLKICKQAMKAICLGITLATVLAASAAGAEIHPRGKGYGASAPHRLPLALRTLSKRSVSVLASGACWRPCTAHCGFHSRLPQALPPVGRPIGELDGLVKLTGPPLPCPASARRLGWPPTGPREQNQANEERE